MARIRTVKPEFWEDEVVGLLSREARLLFIATFNLADDEGLLRWSAPYIKATVFMYDDDLSVADITGYMAEITSAGLLFPYIGGVARQQLAVVVNFRKHQKINRPQPGKLPPPSLQNGSVRRMYAGRDGWTCQLCKRDIPEKPIDNDSWNLSIDHIVHQSIGGSDYPSNVRATHQACNKGRRNGADEDFQVPGSVRAGSAEGSVNGPAEAVTGSVNATGGSARPNDPLHEAPADSVADSDDGPVEDAESWTQSDICSLNGSVNDAVNDSVSHSLAEGKGREQGKEGKGKEASAPAEHDGTLYLVTTQAEEVDTTESRDDDSTSQESETGNAIAVVREDVEQACALLADLIEANGIPRPTIGKRWHDEMRRLIDIDKVPLDDVLGAIRWSTSHTFWRPNILSPLKLRKHYRAMWLQANPGNALAATGTSGGSSHNAGVLERRRARRQAQS